MSERASLTLAQQEALQQAWSLLQEHFDSAVLIYDTEVAEGTDRVYEGLRHGSLAGAIGMCYLFREELMEECFRGSGEES